MEIIRVPAKNENEWLQIITATYPEGQTTMSRTVVCDLHFKSSDILQQGPRKVLAQNALPNVCLGAQKTNTEINMNLFYAHIESGNNELLEQDNDIDCLNHSFNKLFIEEEDEK